MCIDAAEVLDRQADREYDIRSFSLKRNLPVQDISTSCPNMILLAYQ